MFLFHYGKRTLSWLYNNQYLCFFFQSSILVLIVIHKYILLANVTKNVLIYFQHNTLSFQLSKRSSTVLYKNSSSEIHKPLLLALRSFPKYFYSDHSYNFFVYTYVILKIRITQRNFFCEVCLSRVVLACFIYVCIYLLCIVFFFYQERKKIF